MTLATAEDLSQPFAWPEAGVSQVPYRLFSDPEIYALEQQRIFRGPVWNFLCLEIDVKTPGDFKLASVGETPVGPNGERHHSSVSVDGSTNVSIKIPQLRNAYEKVGYDAFGITTRDWESYPILRFDNVPAVETVLIERPGEPFLGVGEATTGPTAGAIANAIYDATGLRLRRTPFDADAIRAAAIA